MAEVSIEKTNRARCGERARFFCGTLLLLFFSVLGSTTYSEAATTNLYFVRGIVKGIKEDEHQLVVAHEAIPDFMEAMTMPFNLKGSPSVANLKIGQPIIFQLHVLESESWIDHIEIINSAAGRGAGPLQSPTPLQGERESEPKNTAHSKNLLREYKFTNELGNAVSLSDFRGKAIALTFMFTRCPIPEFCPRLSRNFQEVQHKFQAMQNAPTNWQLLSVTFDPTRDTPEVLRAYGKSYQYDPRHWSFLTGPTNKIAELARACDVKFEPDGGFFNHNFRTLIIDASNHLQMVFPTSGDISEDIVRELLKAMRASNEFKKPPTNYVESVSDK